MLREFEIINNEGPQQPGTIPMTIDVTGLYTNIPVQEGLRYFEEALERRTSKPVPTAFLMLLTFLVLMCNILVFNGIHYLQLIGVAMGTRLAPTFTCIFMGILEAKFLASWRGTAHPWPGRPKTTPMLVA